jgi:putative transposase
MEKTVAKRERNCKSRNQPAGSVGLTEQAMAEMDAKVAAIQALIPLGLAAVSDALEYEVKVLAGARYQRVGRQPGCVRWSQENGSVYLGDQKLPIRYTRVRDVRANCEVPLLTYGRLQEPGRWMRGC